MERAASHGFSIVNFNQKIKPEIAQLIKKEKIKVYNTNIIYRLLNDLRQDLGKLMPIDVTVEDTGQATVLKVSFKGDFRHFNKFS